MGGYDFAASKPHIKKSVIFSKRILESEICFIRMYESIQTP